MRLAILRTGWALCPVCGTRLCRVEGDAQARGILLWCKRCKGDVRLETGTAR